MDDQQKSNDAPQPAEPGGERNPEVEEFFKRLMEKQDLRRPKPSDEAIAAALQAIQQLGSTESEAQAAASDAGATAPGRVACAKCGHQSQAGIQFCAMCGSRLTGLPSESLEQAPPPAGQHHYHHHYHHHYFAAGQEGEAFAASLGNRSSASTAGRDAVKLRAAVGGAGLSKAEATIRQLTQDWAVACNNKQLDDIVGFYATDALVLRPNVPPLRGTAAIREFFFSALEAGLGDVEMETLRVDLFGDVASEAGRCKMLVPVAMGKRREERGKYLIVYAKQKNGEWQAIVDCWSSDLSLTVSAETPPSIPSKLRR